MESSSKSGHNEEVRISIDMRKHNWLQKKWMCENDMFSIEIPKSQNIKDKNENKEAKNHEPHRRLSSAGLKHDRK